MRKISAHYILTEEGRFLKYGVILLDDNGMVLQVQDHGGMMAEEEGLEFYGGILFPGFVNACIYSSVFQRMFYENEKQQQSFIRILKSRGIVVVGTNIDDSNFSDNEYRVLNIPIWKGEKIYSITRFYCYGKTIIQNIGKISSECPLILLDSNELSESDWACLKNIRSAENTFIVFLEGEEISNYFLYEKVGFPICIGTGNELKFSILKILQEIKGSGTLISLGQLLLQATLNGAQAVGVEAEFGSFKLGKRPHINLLTGVNLRTMEFGSNPTILSVV